MSSANLCLNAQNFLEVAWQKNGSFDYCSRPNRMFFMLMITSQLRKLGFRVGEKLKLPIAVWRSTLSHNGMRLHAGGDFFYGTSYAARHKTGSTFLSYKQKLETQRTKSLGVGDVLGCGYFAAVNNYTCHSALRR